LAIFFIFEKVAKDGKNVRLYIALTFHPFLANFAIFHKWAKNSKKVRLLLLLLLFIQMHDLFTGIARI
jgi:hypothetical protein